MYFEIEGCQSSANIKSNKEFLRLYDSSDFASKGKISVSTVKEIANLKNLKLLLSGRQVLRLANRMNEASTLESINFDYGCCESFLVKFCTLNPGSVYKFIADPIPDDSSYRIGKARKFFKFAGLMCGVLAEATLNSLISVRAIDAGKDFFFVFNFDNINNNSQSLI